MATWFRPGIIQTRRPATVPDGAVGHHGAQGSHRQLRARGHRYGLGQPGARCRDVEPGIDDEQHRGRGRCQAAARVTTADQPAGGGQADRLHDVQPHPRCGPVRHARARGQRDGEIRQPGHHSRAADQERQAWQALAPPQAGKLGSHYWTMPRRERTNHRCHASSPPCRCKTSLTREPADTFQGRISPPGCLLSVRGRGSQRSASGDSVPGPGPVPACVVVASGVEAVAAEGGVDVAVEVAGAGQGAGETAGLVAGKGAGKSTAVGKVAGDLRIRYPCELLLFDSEVPFGARWHLVTATFTKSRLGRSQPERPRSRSGIAGASRIP